MEEEKEEEGKRGAHIPDVAASEGSTRTATGRALTVRLRLAVLLNR